MQEIESVELSVQEIASVEFSVLLDWSAKKEVPLLLKVVKGLASRLRPFMSEIPQGVILIEKISSLLTIIEMKETEQKNLQGMQKDVEDKQNAVHQLEQKNLQLEQKNLKMEGLLRQLTLDDVLRQLEQLKRGNVPALMHADYTANRAVVLTGLCKQLLAQIEERNTFSIANNTIENPPIDTYADILKIWDEINWEHEKEKEFKTELVPKFTQICQKLNPALKVSFESRESFPPYFGFEKHCSLDVYISIGNVPFLGLELKNIDISLNSYEIVEQAAWYIREVLLNHPPHKKFYFILTNGSEFFLIECERQASGFMPKTAFLK